ncbi:uncharacterized protein LOC128238088 [Mya arenaria]|uniref:uncharacterized protein LOC128238088 n=1 Tax=Mya arenaria TaxID=6604 RepID=UPI0022DF7299|nr:uncharacterized protein LOC128238088 [Mya arenaria]
MRWLKWKQSLQNTETIAIPRAYATISFSTAKKSSVNIFSDASEVAIAAVSYLKVTDQVGESSSGFLCRPVCLDVSDSTWIKGPPLLKDQELQIEDNIEESKNYDLINPENDSEIRPEVLTRKTVNVESSITSKFEKFFTWQSLVRAFALLKRSCKDHKKVAKPDVVTSHIEAENFIVRTVQESSYEKEIQLLLSKRAVPASSSLSTLSPFLDEKGVLRVGGRLTKADVPSNSKQPIIIPKKSHIALLLVRHFHEKVQHQGRLLTESTLRNNGFWIIGAKRLISSTIHKCVICKRQRGKFQSQYMSDLPEDRVTPSAPFTVIGVDTFGPWHIVARKTRDGLAEMCAIINSRPIASISTDQDDPEMITPGMLLTQKKEPLEVLDSTLSMRDIYKAQWKYVQVMANTFWKQWRNGYLALQTRRKWPSVLENLKTGDVVLVKNIETIGHWGSLFVSSKVEVTQTFVQ